MKRKLKISVISDVHLGTHGCHAAELLNYLKSIEPDCLIINGDFIDAWQFKKSYFPKPHLEVVQKVLKMALKGTRVYYLTGNHDNILRKFSDMKFDQFHLRDQLTLQINNQSHWFFHGDIFDASILVAPFLARLGGIGYDYLIRINSLINKARQKFNRGPISFAHMVKRSVKKAVKFISDFEEKAMEAAVAQRHQVVVCGHIHQPALRQETVKGTPITYLNSGDWVENLTALEYQDGEWKLFSYYDHFLSMESKPERKKEESRLERKKKERLEQIIKNSPLRPLLFLFS